MKRSWVLILLVLAILATAGYFYSTGVSRKQLATVRIPKPHAPINVRLSALSAPLNNTSAMCHSALVADIIFKGKLSAHWNTPDGLAPDNAGSIQSEDDGYYINTPVQLSITKRLINSVAVPPREFIVGGGSIGGDTMVMEDSVDPQVGQRYLGVFLPTYDPATKKYIRSVLELAAAFRITDDNQVILRARTVEQGQVSQEQQSIGLSDLSHQLSGCASINN